MNFRADRAREITKALIEKDFTGFVRKHYLAPSAFVTLTQYQKEFDCLLAFAPQALTHMFGEVIAAAGLKQLRLAETEKYAHVTFFFNGGIEKVSPGEDRLLIPSVKVATYDLKPEMSALEITEALVGAIQSQKYDVIICNYANADMVGHTGNMPATVKAIEVLDDCLGRVLAAILPLGGEILITADHGNAEKMLDECTGQAHTAHTSGPVPLVYVGRPAKFVIRDGALSDLAPTLLNLLGLSIPAEMTGRALLVFSDPKLA